MRGGGVANGEGTAAMAPGGVWARTTKQGVNAGGGASISNCITTAVVGTGIVLVNHGEWELSQGAPAGRVVCCWGWCRKGVHAACAPGDSTAESDVCCDRSPLAMDCGLGEGWRTGERGWIFMYCL